jgi:hypothetical protein
MTEIKLHRDQFPEYLKSLGLTKGVEVGVYKGGYTELFCKAGLDIMGIDPWQSYEDYNDKRVDFQKQQDELYDESKRRLAPYSNCTLIRKTSMDAVKDFADESLDFVYIDGHHGFKYVAEDIWEWHKKVKKGGIVAGHDYFTLNKDPRHPYCNHVKEVVDAYVLALGIDNLEIMSDKFHSWMFQAK